MRTITIDGLTLEPQQAAHADEIFDVLCDPAIYEHENQPPSSVDWLRERFTRLETRRSPSGDEQWLNWVIRLSGNELIGYVQATVYPDARAVIAYELSSKYWGKGLAYSAVSAMISELFEHHEVRSLSAVLKRNNRRSQRLLKRLEFSIATPEQHAGRRIESGELLMHFDLGPV